MDFDALEMKAKGSFETTGKQATTQSYIPEYQNPFV